MAIKETLRAVGEKELTKIDSLPEEEKKEKFLGIINELENNTDIKEINKYRKKMSQRERLKCYNDGEIISVSGSTKYFSKVPGTPEISLNPLKKPKINGLPQLSLNPLKRPSKNIKEGISKSLFEQGAPIVRLLVNFGILDKPRIMRKKKLDENILNDAKTLKTNMGIFEKVCMFVPQLRLIYPIIKRLKPLTKRYAESGVNVIQEKIDNKYRSKIGKSTTVQLSKVEQDVVKSEIEGKNKSKKN